MKGSGLKTIFLRGLTLAVPVAIVSYVFIRIFGILKNTIGPLAEKTGVHKIFGGLTLTIFALALILIIILLLGLLMRISAIANMRMQIEDVLLRFIPSLNYIKLLANDKLDLENAQNDWKPVILFFEQKYNAAFIVEEDEELITLFVSKGTSLKEGEIITTSKKEVNLISTSYDELHKFNRAFGKGYLSLIAHKEM